MPNERAMWLSDVMNVFLSEQVVISESAENS